MIPYGQNPHGLEERELRFHFIQNGLAIEPDPVQVHNSRLYSWAEFPKDCRDMYGLEWAAQKIELTGSVDVDKDTWGSLQKYYTKKMEEPLPILAATIAPHGYEALENTERDVVFRCEYPGSLDDASIRAFVAEHNAGFVYKSHRIIYPEPYWGGPDVYGKDEDGNTIKLLDHNGGERKRWMVMDKKDFYIYTWMNFSVPEFGSVYVLDTSGSMQNPDYQSVKRSLTIAVSEYTKFYNSYTTGENKGKDSRTWLYNGTYVSNIAAARLGDVTIDESYAPKDYYPIMNRVISKVPRRNSSEAMLTCLYYALCDIHKQVIQKDERENGDIYNRHLRALNFVLLTDESIFTGDTFANIGELTKNDAASLKKHDFPWYRNWQSKGSNSNKFPTTLKDITKTNLIKGINNALKQLSHYCGVNVTWSLTLDLTQDGDYKDCLTFLNKAYENNIDNETTIVQHTATKWWHVPDKTWRIPDGFYTASPHEPMCKIVIYIPAEYTLQTLKPGKVFNENDQYNTSVVMSKWHQDTKTAKHWCAFRYWGEEITLPNADEVGAGTGKWVWERQEASGVILETDYTKELALGATYTPPTDGKTIKYTEVIFKLVLKPYIITLKKNNDYTYWSNGNGTDTTRTYEVFYGNDWPNFDWCRNDIAGSPGSTFLCWNNETYGGNCTMYQYQKPISDKYYIDGDITLKALWLKPTKTGTVWNTVTVYHMWYTAGDDCKIYHSGESLPCDSWGDYNSSYTWKSDIDNSVWWEVEILPYVNGIPTTTADVYLGGDYTSVPYLGYRGHSFERWRLLKGTNNLDRDTHDHDGDVLVTNPQSYYATTTAAPYTYPKTRVKINQDWRGADGTDTTGTHRPFHFQIKVNP